MSEGLRPFPDERHADDDPGAPASTSCCAGAAGAAAAALAWVAARPGVTSVLIGARRLDQLRTNLDAVDTRLSPEQTARLDDVSTPVLNFPAVNNRDLAPSLAFAGATVDGRPTAVPLRRAADAVRY